MCYWFLRQLILITMYCHKLGNVLLIYIYSIYFSQQQLKKNRQMWLWPWGRTRWMDGNTNPMDMSLIKLQVTVKDREAWTAAVHGTAKSLTWRRDWTTMRQVSEYRVREFPGGPVVRTPHFQCKGHRFDHWLRTKIQHVTWCVQKKELRTQIKQGLCK